MSFVAHTGNLMFGMYQLKYSGDWDKALNILLDKYAESAVLGKHTITLGDYDIWISNKWYSYGNLFRVNKTFAAESQYRPSIFTMRRLDRLVSGLKDEFKRKELEKEKQANKDILKEIENKA